MRSQRGTLRTRLAPSVFLLGGALAGVCAVAVMGGLAAVAIRSRVPAHHVVAAACLLVLSVATYVRVEPPLWMQGAYRVPQTTIIHRRRRGFFAFGFNLGLAFRLRVPTFAPHALFAALIVAGSVSAGIGAAFGFAAGRVIEPLRASLVPQTRRGTALSYRLESAAAIVAIAVAISVA